MVKLLRYFLYQIRMNKIEGATFSQLKYFRKWNQSLLPASSSVADEQPWITYDVIDLLDKKLSLASSVFEYGGGGSTLFFVKRAKEVVTVEHDKEWYAILADTIKKKNLTNWKGNFIELDNGDLHQTPEAANPDDYSSTDEKSIGYNYKNYASYIDQFNNNHFDVILVDGRSRASCIKHSIPKIKKGGWLVVDNSDRTYYFSYFEKTLSQEFTLVSNKKGACPYLREFTKTAVWQKK
jgi:predicted O-methyltransferase YrrM